MTIRREREEIRRRLKHGVGMEDVPRRDELLENIRDVLDFCTRTRELPDFVDEVVDDPLFERFEEAVGIERLLVFGSYSREMALRGESDLDLLITIDVDEGDSIFARTQIEDCMLDHRDDVIDGFESWFRSLDVVVVDEDRAGEQVSLMFEGKFMGGKPTPTRGFNLESGELEPI